MLDSNKVRDMLTVDQIIELCCNLQNSDTFFYDAYGNPIFNTCLDHPDTGNSWKQYYYPETKLFRCYTRGESYDVFEMVRRAKGFKEFYDAYKFVVDFFHLKDDGGFV